MKKKLLTKNFPRLIRFLKVAILRYKTAAHWKTPTSFLGTNLFDVSEYDMKKWTFCKLRIGYRIIKAWLERWAAKVDGFLLAGSRPFSYFAYENKFFSRMTQAIPCLKTSKLSNGSLETLKDCSAFKNALKNRYKFTFRFFVISKKPNSTDTVIKVIIL